MDFTISLAHFCEVHGPTSIICTQASTAPCGSCNPCVTPPTDEPHSAYANYGLYDQPSSSLKLGRTPKLSPFETPPTSPRSPSHNPYFPSLSSSDSSFGGRRPRSSATSCPTAHQEALPKTGEGEMGAQSCAAPRTTQFADRTSAMMPAAHTHPRCQILSSPSPSRATPAHTLAPFHPHRWLPPGICIHTP
jgi:hypothetical protein